MSKFLPKLFVVICILIVFQLRSNAALITSFQTGNWNTGATWTGGIIPSAGDSVVIENAHTITISAAPTNIPGAVTVNSGGILTINNNQILTIAGDLLSSPATYGSFNGIGNVTLGGNASRITLDGNYTFSGTLSSATRLNVYFTGSNTQNVTGTTTWRVININKSGGELILSTPLTISTTTTFTAGDVRYNSGTNQTILNANHPGNLTISNSGTILTEPTANRTITGNLEINDGTICNVGGFNFVVTGITNIGNGTSGTLNINSATGTKRFVGLVTVNTGATWDNTSDSPVFFRGGIQNNGTFNVGNGIQTFDTNPQSISGIPTIANLTVTTIILTTQNSLTISTALAGTGTLQLTSSTLTIQGTCTITTLDCITNIPNLVEYTGTSNQTIKNATYYNLDINCTGYTGTLGGNTTVNNYFQVKSGSIFDPSTRNFSVLGNTNIIGEYNDGSNTGVNIFTGNVNINLGATWTTSIITTNANLIFRGGISNVGAFTANAVTFDTNPQIITGISSIPRITSNTTLTYLGSFTISTALAGTGSLIIPANTTLSLGGTATITTLDASTNTPNLVEYIGTANQTIKGTTYFNLRINCSGFIGSLGAATIVNGYLQIESGATLNSAGQNLTANDITNVYGTYTDNNNNGINTFVGLTTIYSGATWATTTVTTAARMIFQNGISNEGSFTGGAATFNSNSQSISGSQIVTFNNGVVVTGIILSNATTNYLSILGVLSGTGAMLQTTNSILKLGGSPTITTLEAAINTPNLVEYIGVAAQTVKGTTYYNLKINCTGFIATLGGATVVNNYLLVETGSTFRPSGQNLTVNGVTDIYGTFGENSTGGTDMFKGLVTIHPNANWSFTVAETPFFENGLLFNGTIFASGTGTYTFLTNNQSISGSQPITFSGAVTITGITVTNANTTTITINGTLGGTGTFIQSTNTLLNLGGNVTITTLDASSNTPNTVNYIGTIAQTVKAISYYNLIISGTSIKTLGATNTVVLNDLSIQSGTLQTATRNLTVSGNTSLYNTGTIDDNSTTGTILLNNLTIEGIWTSTGNESYTINGDLVINSTANITSGTGNYTLAGSNKTISGTTSNASFTNLVVSGSYTNITNITSTASLSGAGSFINGTNGVLTIEGIVTHTNYDFATNPNTVIIKSNFVYGTSFYNLYIDKSGGTANLINNILIGNSFNFISPGYLDLQGRTMTIQNWDDGDIPDDLSIDKSIILNLGNVIIHGVDVGEKAIFPVSISNAATDFARVDIVNNDAANTSFTYATICANIYTDGTCSGSSGGEQVNSYGINLTYNINSNSTNADVSFYWHSSKELAGFNRNFCATNHYDAVNGWEQKGSAGAASLYFGSIYSQTGTFTSFSPGAIGPGDQQLPIELISFDGEVFNSFIYLNWATASEINNDYFTIEKSIDGINFIEISTTKGAGNSNSKIEYEYCDKSPSIGMNYYRLKQTDFNGNFEYSNTISIDVENDVSTFVFPNPNSGKLFNISLNVIENSNVNVQIINSNGIEIYNTSYFILKGISTLQITPNIYITPGVYKIIGTGDNINFSQTIFVK